MPASVREPAHAMLAVHYTNGTSSSLTLTRTLTEHHRTWFPCRNALTNPAPFPQRSFDLPRQRPIYRVVGCVRPGRGQRGVDGAR
jgi:hypothetical protein